ncbi:hypothetical protein J2X76_005310 [Neorhizobium sp. 2083]|nr:hypothetical protein [Neorhizobium sp. 2083]
MLGEASDDVRERLSEKTAQTLDQAENVAADVYRKAASVASDVHEVARQRIVEEAGTYQTDDAKNFPNSRPH